MMRLQEPAIPLRRLGAFVWSAAESAGKQLSSLVLSFVALAFVSPRDLGIFSLCLALLQIFAVVLDDPIGEALLQRAECDRVDWNTGYTANLLLSLAATALVLLATIPLAAVFHEPSIRWALPIMSLNLLVGSTGNIHKYHLARELRFREITVAVLIGSLIGGIITVSLAVTGWGYWSMIVGNAFANLTFVLLFRRACSWRPSFQLVRERLLGLRSFATRSLLVFGILVIRDAMIPLIIGIHVSVSEVGYFSFAMRVSRTLGLLFEDLIRRPLLSLASRLQDSDSHTADFLLDVIVSTTTVVLPAFAGLALVGQHLITLIFDRSWAEAGAFIPILCIVVCGWFALHMPAVALRSIGAAGTAVRLLAWPTAIDLVLLVVALQFTTLYWSITALAVRAVVSLPIIGRVLTWEFGISRDRIVNRLMLPIMATSAMVAAVLLLQVRLGSSAASLIALIVTGVLVYVSFLGGAFMLGCRDLAGSVRRVWRAGTEVRSHS